MPFVRCLTIRIVAFWLLVLIAPGSSEAIENLAHLATSGHFAHSAESNDTHSEPGPEHGCTGTFHLCACHGPVSGTFAVSALGVECEPTVGRLAQESRLRYSAYLGNIEHPPQAQV